MPETPAPSSRTVVEGVRRELVVRKLVGEEMQDAKRGVIFHTTGWGFSFGCLWVELRGERDGACQIWCGLGSGSQEASDVYHSPLHDSPLLLFISSTEADIRPMIGVFKALQSGGRTRPRTVEQ